MNAARGLSPRFDSLLVTLVAVVGTTFTFWLWHSVSSGEEARDELAFSRQVEARHALIRQTLIDYEDCLLAMRLFMVHGREIDQAKFASVARGQLARYPGFLGLQWAPQVTQAEREAWERVHAGSLGALARIHERSPEGTDSVAASRDEYFPVLFAEPLEGNRRVIGTDAQASPLRSVFAASQASGAVTMSGRLKLVYETGPNDGIIMACPVLEDGPAGTEPRLRGFLLGVFRVVDLLVQPWNRAPGSVLEVMFVDESATRPDRRVLYCHLHSDEGRPVPTEEEFCREPHRRTALQVAGRNWSVIYRRAAGVGLASRGFPLLALGAGLIVTGLTTSLLLVQLRRTRTVQRQVAERTAELSESRRQLGALMHALPGMAFRGTYDHTLVLTFVSEGVRDLTGYEAAELMEGRVHWREIVHPDDLPWVRASTRAAIEDGRELELEYRIRMRAGVQKWVLTRGRGVKGAGRPAVFEGLAIDITAQKEAETARLSLERKLLEGQKLESLGLLAGGVAHDFNNLLSTMLGNAELAQLTLPSGHAAGVKLRAIETAATHAAELCRQMLAFAGKGRLVVESTDLSALIEGMVPLLKVSSSSHAQLRLELDRKAPPVQVDATQIRQIVMNLVMNAAEALGKKGGEIVLRTGVVQATPERLNRCVAGASLPPGDYVCLEVRDNGAGMPPEVCARIFDPFFTTKSTGRGLGLAAVLGIVRGHGGAMCVSSQAGEGTTFHLLLPPGGRAVRPASPLTGDGGVAWRRAGRALVVDDQPHVRAVMAEMLRGFGFTAEEMAGGRETIDAVRADLAGVELVVLDLLMPGLGGEATLKALRGINPRLRILLMSGFSEDGLVQRLVSGGAARFLAKPFTRASLERELRALFG